MIKNIILIKFKKRFRFKSWKKVTTGFQVKPKILICLGLNKNILLLKGIAS